MSRERGKESFREGENINNNFKNCSNGIFTIFVSNLPQNLDIFGFRGIFSKMGSIVDASIPASRGGAKRFGFIRFQNQESVSKSIRLLNRKVIRNSKILVFEARRDMSRSKKGEEESRGARDARGGEKEAFWKNRNQAQQNKGTGFKNQNFSNRFDIFNKEDVSEKCCIKGEVNKTRLNRLLCSLVGESDLPMRVDFIWNQLRLENIGLKKVIGLQKNKFILEFENEDEADSALTSSQALVDLFSGLKKWAWTDCTEKRFVWLEVIGVPPQGWSLTNFKDIARNWGKLVGFDKNIEDPDDLESIKLLVLTSKMRNIVDDVILDLENTSFRLWVEEVEEPELKKFFNPEDFEPKVSDVEMSEGEEEEGEIGEEDERSTPNPNIEENGNPMSSNNKKDEVEEKDFGEKIQESVRMEEGEIVEEVQPETNSQPELDEAVNETILEEAEESQEVVECSLEGESFSADLQHPEVGENKNPSKNNNAVTSRVQECQSKTPLIKEGKRKAVDVLEEEKTKRQRETSSKRTSEEEELRRRALKTIKFGNKIGVKVVKNPGNEEAAIRRAARVIKKQRRYISCSSSEEDSNQSQSF